MNVKEQAAVQPFLQIHPEDNVLVALKDLAQGTSLWVQHEELVLQVVVAANH